MVQKIPQIRNNDQFRKYATFDKKSYKLDNMKEGINFFPNTTVKNTINSYNEIKTDNNFGGNNYNKYRKRNNSYFYFSPIKTKSENNNRNKLIIKPNIQYSVFKSFDVYKITPKKTKLDFKNYFLSLNYKNSLYKFNDSINSIRRLDKLYLDCLKRTIHKFYLNNFDSTKSFFNDFKSDKKSKYVTIDDITKYFNDKIFIKLSKNEIRNLFHVVSNQVDFDNFIKIFHLKNYNKINNEDDSNNTNDENKCAKTDENNNKSIENQEDNFLIKDEYDLNEFCALCKKLLKSVSEEICKKIFEVESDKKDSKININTLIKKYYFDFVMTKSQKRPQKNLIDSITVFNLSKYDTIENSNSEYLKINKILNLKLILKYLAEKIATKQYEVKKKPKIIIQTEIKYKDINKNKDKIEEKKENINKKSYIQRIFRDRKSVV